MPPFPELDQSKYARVIVEFLSGTPAMAYFCSRVDILSDRIRLEATSNTGELKPVVEIGRDRVQRMVVDFDLRPIS